MPSPIFATPVVVTGKRPRIGADGGYPNIACRALNDLHAVCYAPVRAAARALAPGAA